ncbi:MAG: restriction endonuclease subunit S [Anaerovibrio sp.]
MEYVRLGDIAEIYNGNSINKKVKQEKYTGVDDGYNFIATKDVGFDGTVNYNNGVKIPFEESGFKTAPSNAVFVCSEGGSAGKKTAIISQEVCFGNKLYAIVSKNKSFIGKYFYYYTRYKEFFTKFQNEMNGIIGGVSQKKFCNITVPMTDIQEQKYIVARIEELFSELENGIENLKKAKAQLNVYRKAVISESYPELSDKISKKLMDIAEISSGITKGRNLDEHDTIKLPYLRVANVQNGYLDLSEMKDIELKKIEKEKFLLHYGDVLYTEGGDRDKLGRGTIWKNEIPECVHQNHVFKARIKDNIALPKYVSYWSMSKYARNYFFRKGKQSVNLASINKTVLSNLELPIVSIAEQEEIIKHIEEKLSACENIEKTVDTALEQAETMRQSILKQAFEGRL